jgi:hypothetical protein
MTPRMKPTGMAVSKPEYLLAAREAFEAAVMGASVASLLALLWGIRRWRRSFEPRLERRHAYRVSLETPVFVYGWRKGEPFLEATKTINVSAVGGLIPLSSKIVRSQLLIVTNLQSDEDSSCRVARLTRCPRGKIAVGFEFAKPSATFWQVEFISDSPPDNVEPGL